MSEELYCFEFKVKLFVNGTNQKSAFMRASQILLDGDFSENDVEILE